MVWTFYSSMQIDWCRNTLLADQTIFPTVYLPLGRLDSNPNGLDCMRGCLVCQPVLCIWYLDNFFGCLYYISSCLKSLDDCLQCLDVFIDCPLFRQSARLLRQSTKASIYTVCQNVHTVGLIMKIVFLSFEKVCLPVYSAPGYLDCLFGFMGFQTVSLLIQTISITANPATQNVCMNI